MNQPNPWILLMGGFALLNVAAMIYGAKSLQLLPPWARVVGAVLFGLMGITSLILAMIRQFANKPAPPPKTRRIVTDPDVLIARARELEKQARKAADRQ